MNNMEASFMFNNLMKECIKPLLVSCSFSSKGNTFISQKNDNWILLNFQKSHKSTANAVIFTVNLGVASSLILDFFSKAIRPTTIEDCHWRQRIGFVLPQHKDTWWTIKYGTDIPLLCNELQHILVAYALPELNIYSHDYNLRDLWLDDKAPGITDIQRLMFLSILVNSIGPFKLLSDIVNKMLIVAQNKPINASVKSLINRLTNYDTYI